MILYYIILYSSTYRIYHEYIAPSDEVIVNTLRPTDLGIVNVLVQEAVKLRNGETIPKPLQRPLWPFFCLEMSHFKAFRMENGHPDFCRGSSGLSASFERLKSNGSGRLDAL